MRCPICLSPARASSYTGTVKIALAQINPTVGDFSGNVRKIVDNTHAAETWGADLVIFPELAICGYPPADLLEKPSFLLQTQQALEQVALAATVRRNVSVLCGCVTADSRLQSRGPASSRTQLAAQKLVGVAPYRSSPVLGEFL